MTVVSTRILTWAIIAIGCQQTINIHCIITDLWGRFSSSHSHLSKRSCKNTERAWIKGGLRNSAMRGSQASTPYKSTLPTVYYVLNNVINQNHFRFLVIRSVSATKSKLEGCKQSVTQMWSETSYSVDKFLGQHLSRTRKTRKRWFRRCLIFVRVGLHLEVLMGSDSGSIGFKPPLAGLIARHANLEKYSDFRQHNLGAPMGSG